MNFLGNIVEYEAFVYLWFDAKERKFYLGYHGGHEEDNYTHSSKVMESFSKKDIPSYMRRRILARGSCVEMEQLEIHLLNNRSKCERRWEKYYNVIVAFPPPPMFGFDNPQYIDGRSGDPEYKRNYYEKHRERDRPKKQEYRKNNAERIKEYNRRWREENRENLNEKNRTYYEKNKDREKQKHQRYREKNREKIRQYKREYDARKKSEKRSTLDAFFG